jgi:hypothetical protein
VQQRIRGNGGWSEGDATFSGENPPQGAVITYYQKARHVIGRMKLEIVDAQGKVVDELPASKRKGLNRVVWGMRTKPPQVPPAASLAYYSTQGQRVLPGEYTVRLTKAGKVMTMPLTVGLDPRAKYTVEDRAAQYAAAERVKGLFGRMSQLNANINGIRAQADQAAKREGASAKLRKDAAKVTAEADALRKQLVATKEGGAITGEERLRENVDYIYGAVTSVESAPTAYQLARIDALERELGEVEQAFERLKGGAAARLSTAMVGEKLPPIDFAVVIVRPEDAKGGPAAALAHGLIGMRYYGSLRDIRVNARKR